MEIACALKLVIWVWMKSQVFTSCGTLNTLFSFHVKFYNKAFVGLLSPSGQRVRSGRAGGTEEGQGPAQYPRPGQRTALGVRGSLPPRP